MTTADKRLLTIKPAIAADAATLAKFAERCFRAAFAQQNRAEDIDHHCNAAFCVQRQTAEITCPNILTFLVHLNNELAAFAQLHLSEPPSGINANNSEQYAEIRRFYVDARWHGKGIAQHLMDECLAKLKQLHMTKVWLGVWQQNPKAIAFYRKFGFETVGEQCFLLGTDRQMDFIMARSLNEQPVETIRQPTRQ